MISELPNKFKSNIIISDATLLYKFDGYVSFAKDWVKISHNLKETKYFSETLCKFERHESKLFLINYVFINEIFLESISIHLTLLYNCCLNLVEIKLSNLSQRVFLRSKSLKKSELLKIIKFVKFKKTENLEKIGKSFEALRIDLATKNATDFPEILFECEKYLNIRLLEFNKMKKIREDAAELLKGKLSIEEETQVDSIYNYVVKNIFEFLERPAMES